MSIIYLLMLIVCDLLYSQTLFVGLILTPSTTGQPLARHIILTPTQPERTMTVFRGDRTQPSWGTAWAPNLLRYPGSYFLKHSETICDCYIKPRVLFVSFWNDCKQSKKFTKQTFTGVVIRFHYMKNLMCIIDLSSIAH